MATRTVGHEEHQRRWSSERASIWRCWTNFVPLADAASAPAVAGPYVLGVRWQRPSRQGLVRLLGSDIWSILDIGESSNLKARLATLCGCASGARGSGHMAGWRYAYLGLRAKMEPHELVVAWKTSADSYRVEAETMTAHLNAFGELPPLNYKANWALVG